MANILILSAGTRNKVVQYFRKELAGRGKVYATDCSSLAPAIYEADEAILVPRITEPGYVEQILEICREKRITGVLSLIDPELTLLAQHREAFLAVGSTPIISSAEAVAVCLDKYRMYEKLGEMGIPTGRCFLKKEDFLEAVQRGEMTYPVFVKPAKGSASLGISRVDGANELDFYCAQGPDMMIQEYMDDTEYGADVYIDMITGKTVSIFLKEKIRMRAGETDKSVSVKDDGLFDLIRHFVETMEFRGVIDIDIFRVDGEYYISEVNPRFGGGYPHAWECGVNMPAMILKNLEGQPNEEAVGAYDEGIGMMTYKESMTLRLEKKRPFCRRRPKWRRRVGNRLREFPGQESEVPAALPHRMRHGGFHGFYHIDSVQQRFRPL